MKAILFIVATLFADGALASDNNLTLHSCSDLYKLAGVDRLAKFKRVNGVYKIDIKKLGWIELSRYGWPGVFIPPHNYGAAELFDAPFEGVAFDDKINDIGIRIYHHQQSIRTSLYVARKPEADPIFDKYKNKSIFSFLEGTLGVIVDGFDCNSNTIDKSFAMLMSVVVLPINNNLTNVYLLKNPRALLLVSAVSERKQLHLIFPNTANVDVLDYVLISAPERHIADIVNRLDQVSD